MKIDITKKYRTRDGREVKLLHRVPEGWPTEYPWHGIVDGRRLTWTDHGLPNLDDSPNDEDLIEVREPREWVLSVKPGTLKVSEIYEDEGPLDLHGWERVRVREIID